MRKILMLISISILLLFTSCNNKKEQIVKLKSTNDSLVSCGLQKDTTVLAYVAAFNSIQANLDSIKSKEMIIDQNIKEGELNQDAKDHINQDINTIYQLLKKNRQIVANLKNKLRKSNARIDELEKMVINLNNQIEFKNADINVLKEYIEKLNIKVAEISVIVNDISADNKLKSQKIADQTKALNTAYYAIGTYKELRDNNVVIKDGGFSGLGRNILLKENFNKEYFTCIDITTFEGLAISKKKINIITNHAKNSYKLTASAKTIDSLKIKDPVEFWNSSKYLVIVTN